jgi:hypothetical protein
MACFSVVGYAARFLTFLLVLAGFLLALYSANSIRKQPSPLQILSSFLSPSVCANCTTDGQIITALINSTATPDSFLVPAVAQEVGWLLQSVDNTITGIVFCTGFAILTAILGCIC